jgi:signal transduction histidine kinase
MSLRVRLLGAFAYALVIVIVALEVPLVTNLNDRVDAEIEGESAAEAQILAASVDDQLSNSARLDQVASEAADRIGGRVFIVDGSGAMLTDSAGEVPPGTPYATEAHPPLLRALAGEVSHGRHPPDLDELSTAVPIVRAGRTVGALEVEQNFDRVTEERREDVAALIGIGILALALGLGVAWILAGSIARPINALARVARRMAGGDLAARAKPAGSKEQVEVANAFNEMADRLEGVFESQRAFVADASHQLRTPLTGLRLRLEAAEAKAGKEASKDLAAAEVETERLAALVEDLLALASSEEPGHGEGGELSASAAEAAERWRDAATGQDHELRMTGEGAVPVRAGDRDLAAILDNLIENALKYSPRGTPVVIDWAAREDGAVLSVASEGGPLSDAERAHAFERFYRGEGSSDRRGTGLGLAIVAALARRNGGAARLGNKSGGGVIAEVRFPSAGR